MQDYKHHRDNIRYRDFYFRAPALLVDSVFPSRLTFPQFSPPSSLKPLADAQTGWLLYGQRP
jgi:hypothetical protein